MRNVDRRQFLNAHWTVRDGAPASGSFDVASVLVQARPERLDAVAAAITALPGAQIYGRDAKGKLVVVLEADDAGGIGATLSAMSLLPDVLTASLVFHGTDCLGTDGLGTDGVGLDSEQEIRHGAQPTGSS
jgi:nitrate reductase NapD